MVEIIGVRFNNAGKVYYFDPGNQKLRVGCKVLVETARGIELGHIVTPNKEVDESEIVSPLKKIVRIADENDIKQFEENKVKEKEAFIIANEQIDKFNIDMKLVDVEYTFDRSKILFYFTAEGRVDFRELVKALASIFHTRIELRQIGVRDEARQIGSYGICGRYLCCGSFLDDFKPVSIKMAKEQGLSLNPTKISGTCGRLMCCLQYEQNAYDDMIKKLPQRGTLVETSDGTGCVIDLATLKGEIKVKFENGDDVRYGNYKIGEFKIAGKGGRVEFKAPDDTEESEADVFKSTEEAVSEPESEAKSEAAAKKKKFKPKRYKQGGKKNPNKKSSNEE